MQKLTPGKVMFGVIIEQYWYIVVVGSSISAFFFSPGKVIDNYPMFV
jgi:hypothetical protein